MYEAFTNAEMLMQSVRCAVPQMVSILMLLGLKKKRDPVYKVSIKVCIRHSHNRLLYTRGLVKAICVCLALLHVLFSGFGVFIRVTLF